MADVELNSIGNGNGTNYLVRDNTKIPLAGTNALAGSIVPDTDNSYDLGDSSHNFKIVYAKEIRHGLSGGVLILRGGNGANIELWGNNNSQYAGWVSIKAIDNNGQYQMILKPDGTFKWGSKNVAMQEDTIPRSGGAVLSGTDFYKNVDSAYLRFCGATDYLKGASILMRGKDFVEDAGTLTLAMRNGNLTKLMNMYPSGTWTWQGTACQTSSDQRLKQQIAEIDDKLLDAWKDVELVQFKYNDAVEQKGEDKARLHTGYVVQQIDSACKSHNVDISKYGLYCHEEYPEETEEVEVEQEDGTKVKETKVIEEAKEHYSLRYTEALIVECAYLRKKNKNLQEQLNALSERLEKLENR